MDKYGRLKIIRPLDATQDKKKRFLCECECGTQTIVFAENLLSGHTKSCGCLKREIIAGGAHKTHGLSRTRIYRIWKGMRKRCNNPNDSNYPKYGGRGIKVCPEWEVDFLSFYFWAMENGYNDLLSLPSVITPERFTRMALSCLNTTPKLAECSHMSFLSALMNAAQLGLEPNTPTGQAYLIPYRNKGKMECQFQVGYKGLLDLVYRNPDIQTVQAQCVYENDTFEYELGLNG